MKAISLSVQVPVGKGEFYLVSKLTKIKTVRSFRVFRLELMSRLIMS